MQFSGRSLLSSVLSDAISVHSVLVSNTATLLSLRSKLSVANCPGGTPCNGL